MNHLMRAVRCHRYAGLDDQGKPVTQPIPLREVLSLDEVPTPQCAGGEVLVEVHYAGVQYPDALQAQGLYQERPPLPYIPGIDLSGVVAQVGAGVDQLAVGDRVIAVQSTGGLAEFANVSAQSVWKVPNHVHLSQCANIGRNFFPAYHSLKVIGEVVPGDLVLVDGASGGVGMAAVELAKAMGAKVIAGVSSEAKMDAPASAGADRVFRYGTDRDQFRQFKDEVRAAAKEFGHPAGVDVVVDMVQGELFESALVSCIRPLGKICLVGFTAGQTPIRPGILLIKQAAVVGSLWAHWAAANRNAQQQHAQEILDFMATGAIKPRADRVIPLEKFIDAFEIFEHNRGRGNTVVCLREP